MFADSESAVPPGDVEIHSELNDIAQPGYRGTKTTLIPSDAFRDLRARGARSGKHATARRRGLRRNSLPGRFRPADVSGDPERGSIGRGGDDFWVDLALYTTEEISREHLRLRRDPSSGQFKVTDLSRNGTWLNGRRIAGNVEVDCRNARRSRWRRS